MKRRGKLGVVTVDKQSRETEHTVITAVHAHAGAEPHIPGQIHIINSRTCLCVCVVCVCVCLCVFRFRCS